MVRLSSVLLRMSSVRHLSRLVRHTTSSSSVRWGTLIYRRAIVSTGQTCFASSQAGSETSQTGQKGPSEEARRRARNLQIATGAACAFFGASYILYLQLKAEEVAAAVEEGPEEVEDRKEKKRRSFHDQRVIGYEDRIRAFSTPDKIFRYFATLNIRERNGASYIYMTPDDFLRSITPGIIQPSGLGLDQFRTMSIGEWKEKCAKGKKQERESVFSKFGNHGLISFSDYLFLLTILATPVDHFEVAFKMFDLNGDGEVDVGEFETVRGVVLNSTAVGARHRDHLVTGSVAGSVGDALVEHFFGPERDQLLTVDKFREFHEKLRMEVLRLEFERFDPEEGRISENDFTKLVLSYAEMNDQRKKKYLKRVRKVYGKELFEEGSKGVTLEEVKAFSKLVQSISDVEIALGMYLAAGASITGADLKSVAKAVADVELSDHLVDVVIVLFDEDNDGNLSHREFTKVMKSRTTRGLEKSKELGVARLMGSIAACSSKVIKDKLGIKS